MISYRLVPERWLLENDIRYCKKLYLRKDNDFRQDSIVKAEILQQILDDGYHPFLVVDDRPQVVDMWRSFGICALQCAPDEIQPKHEGKHFLDILIGPSGAGKSTYAQQKYMPGVRVSTDEIRALNSWGHSPEDLNATFRYAHGLLKLRLEQHLITCFDATNLKKKDRLAVMRNIPRGQYVRYVVIDRPLDDKLRDRGWRPEELVLKHHKTFQAQLKDILAGDDQSNVVVIDARAK